MTTLQPSPPPAALPDVGLPAPRGPITERLLAHLALSPHELQPFPEPVDDPIEGDDSALALYLCYELHYRGLPGVDEAWEWEPSLLRERQRLERRFEDALVARVGAPPIGLPVAEVRTSLLELSSTDAGPSLSARVEATGTLDELRELAVHRSAYQLKEADPHTWGIPRLAGPAKIALVTIQADEYGSGDPELAHATLFAHTMRGLGLDDRYGALLDAIPGVTLATCNLISLFGLHRRWRGALIGHLALFEMCSVVPMGRYASACRRLGLDDLACRFYDVHVDADEVHQHIALDDMVVPLVEDEPFLGGEVVFGARALTELERAFAAHIHAAWDAGRTSLRAPDRT